MSKFCGGTKIYIFYTVSKVYLVGVINKTVVKNVINVFNCGNKAHIKSKQRILGENGLNWVILSSKITS